MMIFSVLEEGEIRKTAVDGISFDESCDVLCVGAGSAGIYAADGAAREGAEVVLLEISENIGGMHVCGNVTTYYHGSRGGSYEEEETTYLADRTFPSKGTHWELRQIGLYRRLKSSQIRLYCRNSPTGVYLEEDRVVGLRVFDGRTERNIRAKIVVDATSDGHVLRMLDVKKEYGRSIDGTTVPFTVRTQYFKNGKLCSDNRDSGTINPYDCRDFSRNTVFAHANAARLLNEGEFIGVALQTGIREGLRFEGEEKLSVEDILLEKAPEKILFWAYSDLDRHGYDRALDEELFQNWWVVSNLATVTVQIPVPMGSVVPKGVRGIVTAGRCLSCDTYTQSAVRMNRDMFRMGECVGRGAAMAVAQDADFCDIDYEKYLDRVRSLGCFRETPERGFGFDNTYRRYLDKMKSLGRTPDPKYQDMKPKDNIYEPLNFDPGKNWHLLSTDAPGPAVWSCYRHSTPQLREKTL